jgi:hypothetical protein
MTVVGATFKDVWFRYSESSWSDFELLAWQDKGTLEVRDGALNFRGGKYALEIWDFISVSLTSQGRDFINTWVRVDYREAGSPRVAFFNDGSDLGWGGVLGGASRLGAAITEAAGLASGTPAQVGAGWFADPTGRHELRYWGGSSWTEHVSDGGVVSADPLSESSGA